jgi:osmoprotectant transport system substrate-binding protein
MKIARAVAILIACWILASCGANRRDVIVIGSKNFTEQVVLGELLAQQIEAKTHLKVERRFYLAGTYICHQAILAGRIDAYVEYTGTALSAVLKQREKNDPDEVYERVKNQYASRFNLEVMPQLGFNNTFAMLIRGVDARRLNLHTLTEAAQVTPQWRAGFGYEFMDRPDGYRGLVKTYGLKFAAPPRIMELGLIYRALVEKQVDMVDGDSTNGLIAALDLAVLEDDRHYFPPYQAVPIVRRETLDAHPEVRAALEELGGRISEVEMRKMNYAVDGEHRNPKIVAAEFLRDKNL